MSYTNIPIKVQQISFSKDEKDKTSLNLAVRKLFFYDSLHHSRSKKEKEKSPSVVFTEDNSIQGKVVYTTKSYKTKGNTFSELIIFPSLRRCQALETQLQ